MLPPSKFRWFTANMAGRAKELGPTSVRVAANLRRIRQELGLSYAELARRLTTAGHPIIDTGLMKIEKGDRRVDVDDLVALAVALETTPNKLLLPEMDVEHASDMHQLTSEIRETPPLLWAWACGDVPLGRLPSTASTDRTSRNEEVAFSRDHAPHRWGSKVSDKPPATSEQILAATGLVAFAAESFRAGSSTMDIREVTEGALVSMLVSSDPMAGKTRISRTQDGQVVVDLNSPQGNSGPERS